MKDSNIEVIKMFFPGTVNEFIAEVFVPVASSLPLFQLPSRIFKALIYVTKALRIRHVFVTSVLGS